MENTAKQKNVVFSITNGGKFSSSHRKEKNCYDEYTAIIKTGEGFKTPVTIRTYYTASGGSNTAAVWINSNKKNIHVSGTGSAGGFGYHRPSAAVYEALKNAGVSLPFPISGRGDSAIRDAVQAIAEALGYRKNQIYVHKANS